MTNVIPAKAGTHYPKGTFGTHGYVWRGLLTRY